MSNAFSRQVIFPSNHKLLRYLFSLSLSLPHLGFTLLGFATPESSKDTHAPKTPATKVSTQRTSAVHPRDDRAGSLNETQRYILADLRALVTYQERIDWITDETAIHSLKPRLLELGCRLESEDLKRVETLISRRIQRAGSVEQRWLTQRRTGAKRPELSRASVRTGVVAFQLWLFCPSTYNTLIFSADAGLATVAKSTATAIHFFRVFGVKTGLKRTFDAR